MTGEQAEASAQPGAPFTAWDGYISGASSELEPYSRIVQMRGGHQFPASPIRKIEVLWNLCRRNAHHHSPHQRARWQTGYENGGSQARYFEPDEGFLRLLNLGRGSDRWSADSIRLTLYRPIAIIVRDRSRF